MDTEMEAQVERERSAAAAMLGLPGFVVLAVSDSAGELEQAIETTADVVGCPECGAVAQLHDRRPTWVRDLPSGGSPVTLVWVKRVWRCGHPRCPKRTWTEASEGPFRCPRHRVAEKRGDSDERPCRACAPISRCAFDVWSPRLRRFNGTPLQRRESQRICSKAVLRCQRFMVT